MEYIMADLQDPYGFTAGLLTVIVVGIILYVAHKYDERSR